MVLTSNFKFDLLLKLRSMVTTYLHNVPTMMDPPLSSIFLIPKVISPGEISHSIYIITNLARDYYNFGTELIKSYIQSLTNN